jgi:hypothetical protein
VNNNSQGFRDNFASIRTNLNTAGTEITDLQNKVIVKSALANSTVNNDMANTLISNALTRSFRASTYNLGNALSGVVSVNVSLGDVQYGTIAANTTIQFTGWGPTGTQSNVQLQLAVSNNLAVLSFPSQVTDGVMTLENYANIANTNTVTVPYGITQLDYRFSTLDCGNTITVEPFNNNRIALQVKTRNVIPTGNQGDVNGDVAVGTAFNQLSVVSSNTGMSLSTVVISNTSGGFTCSTTSRPLSVGQQLRISGTAGGTGSISGYSDPSTYYIIATDGATTFQLSTTSGGSNITTTAGTPTGLTYKINDGYLNVANTTQLYTDMPVVFTGVSMEANITVGTTYYVRNVSANTYFTVSTALGGANVNLAGNASPTIPMYANPVTYLYVCTDDYNSTEYVKSTTATNSTGNVTLNNTTSLANNSPIIFTGTTFGGITANTVYYIKAIGTGGNITISQSRTNGVADTAFTLTTASGTCVATAYVGSDIWKRIALTSW